MSNKQDIACSFNEAWEKLSARWKGEEFNSFYQQYIAKMAEVVVDFEEACFDLDVGAADLAKKLEVIEHDII